MIVYTDSLDYAQQVLPDGLDWRAGIDRGGLNSGLRILFENLYHGRDVHHTILQQNSLWKYLFIVATAPSSHYDLMVALARQNVVLPDGTLSLAGTGSKFHGQRGRQWVGLPGNIHLTVHFAPDLNIHNYGAAFSALAAVSVVEAIDQFAPLKGKAEIKWVNDIFIENAKVSGFLTNCQSLDDKVTAAIIGIGLNVEAAPEIVPNKFVQNATSLREHCPDQNQCGPARVLKKLLRKLEYNYAAMTADGPVDLIARYRKRSMIIGREVEIISDSPRDIGNVIASGTVADIGSNLEIVLSGQPEPIRRGRLVIKR